MFHATRTMKLARHAASFLLHFAHGGLLVAGIIVTVFLCARISGHGVEGLSLARAAANEPIVVASAADEISSDVELASAEVEEEAAPSEATHLSPELQRVKGYLAKRYRVSAVAIEPLIAAAQQTGRKVGIDPLLLVSVMAIESSFNPFAESPMGAQGLMQVIPKFHPDKVDVVGDRAALFDPMTNIRVGAQVLKEAIRRTGSLQSGLQQYGGALDDPEASYANRVLSVKERLAAAARRRAASGRTVGA